MMNAPALSLASALMLGFLHSLEPSHAKAVLASYFLDRRRTLVEAVLFAGVVTVAHTMTIFLLAAALFGGETLFEGRVAAERWAEAGSGLLMVALGAWMFRAERRARFHRDDPSDEEHACGHFFHHHNRHHHDPAPASMRQVFVIGFCSGSIPCMTGIAVMLQAWATGTPARAFALLGVFSLGLGSVVLAMSVATQQAAQFMDRYWSGSARWTRFLPTVSAALIFAMGVVVLAQAMLGAES